MPASFIRYLSNDKLLVLYRIQNARMCVLVILLLAALEENFQIKGQLLKLANTAVLHDISACLLSR